MNLTSGKTYTFLGKSGANTGQCVTYDMFKLQEITVTGYTCQYIFYVEGVLLFGTSIDGANTLFGLSTILAPSDSPYAYRYTFNAINELGPDDDVYFTTASYPIPLSTKGSVNGELSPDYYNIAEHQYSFLSNDTYAFELGYIQDSNYNTYINIGNISINKSTSQTAQTISMGRILNMYEPNQNYGCYPCYLYITETNNLLSNNTPEFYIEFNGVLDDVPNDEGYYESYILSSKTDNTNSAGRRTIARTYYIVNPCFKLPGF